MADFCSANESDLTLQYHDAYFTTADICYVFILRMLIYLYLSVAIVECIGQFFLFLCVTNK